MYTPVCPSLWKFQMSTHHIFGIPIISIYHAFGFLVKTTLLALGILKSCPCYMVWIFSEMA